MEKTSPRDSALRDILGKYESAPDVVIGKPLTSVESRTAYGDQILHLVCVTGDVADARALIALGANINAVGEDGYVPLHYATEQGNAGVVALLLASGADRDVRNGDGDTPMDIALAGGDQKIADLLTEKKETVGSDIHCAPEGD